MQASAGCKSYFINQKLCTLDLFLVQVSLERNTFEQGLIRMQVEKMRMAKEREEQMDNLASRSVERLNLVTFHMCIFIVLY